MKLSTPEKIIVAILLVIVLLTVCFFMISGRSTSQLSVRQTSFSQNVQDDTDRIDINTASAEQLKTLDGIGSKTAGKIIEYRENTHPFTAPSDIMNVDGIGIGTYEKIKDRICVR